MRGTRLKAFIVKVRDSGVSETFYILAHDIDQARLRAFDLSLLSQQKSSSSPVAA